MLQARLRGYIARKHCKHDISVYRMNLTFDHFAEIQHGLRLSATILIVRNLRKFMIKVRKEREDKRLQ